MDKLTVVSGTLFLAADVFAIISLAMPDWIITEGGGNTRLGLMWTCMTLYNRSQVCFTPDLQPEWLLALVCIFVGCICITTTIILLASSHWDRNVVPYARWVGFTAMVLFCLAAVIFPMGFHIEEIGGQPYQLPNSHQVGISYILFVLALWITVISELFAACSLLDYSYIIGLTPGFSNISGAGLIQARLKRQVPALPACIAPCIQATSEVSCGLNLRIDGSAACLPKKVC